MGLYGRTVLRPLISRSAATIVCVDKWTYENALSLFATQQNTVVIPVSVELDRMKGGNGEKIRNRLGIVKGPLILSLGHVVPLRDRIRLVHALPLLTQKFPDLRVVIVGMVKDSRFIALAERLEVSRFISLIGPVPHEQIRDYLAAADVETHDLDGRGLGITSVEAMDAEVPIVAWATDDNFPQYRLRSYGPSGLIDDGEPSTIAQKIEQLITDEDFRRTAIESQTQLVRDVYSVESITRQYLQLLA